MAAVWSLSREMRHEIENESARAEEAMEEKAERSEEDEQEDGDSDEEEVKRNMSESCGTSDDSGKTDPSTAEKSHASSAEDAKHNYQFSLPMSRVRKAASEVISSHLPSDAGYAIQRAAELFLEYLVEQASPRMGNSNQVDVLYDDLADTVEDDENLQFLLDIVPNRCPLDVVDNATPAGCEEEANYS